MLQRRQPVVIECLSQKAPSESMIDTLTSRAAVELLGSHARGGSVAGEI